jgi:hypothetical protein
MKYANKNFIKLLNQIAKDEFPNSFLLRFFTNDGVSLTYWTPDNDVEYNMEGFVTPKLYKTLQARYNTEPTDRPNGPVMRHTGGS